MPTLTFFSFHDEPPPLSAGLRHLVCVMMLSMAATCPAQTEPLDLPPGVVEFDMETGEPLNSTAAIMSGEPELLQEVVVEAERISAASGLTVGRAMRVAGIALQPVTEMSGEKLARRAQGTLGETLSWEPGVTSAYFGPGSSRPIIRGFDGFRVKMLRDDLSTMDLSDTSPDHGIGLEPLLAESLEVHRGPSALLYGNSAIGGAVNTRSRTLARELPLRAHRRARLALRERLHRLGSNRVFNRNSRTMGAPDHRQHSRVRRCSHPRTRAHRSV